MRRVSYHQSVFDLLDIQSGESPQAREMIETRGARCGRRLPEAVRQWYLIDAVVALQDESDWNIRVTNQLGHLWYNFSNMDNPRSLEAVLHQFAEGRTEESWHAGEPPAGSVRVMVENRSRVRWYVQPAGSADPPVIVDDDLNSPNEEPVHWVRVADRFSAFLFDWFARFYFEDFTPLAERERYIGRRIRPPRENLRVRRERGTACERERVFGERPPGSSESEEGLPGPGAAEVRLPGGGSGPMRQRMNPPQPTASQQPSGETARELICRGLSESSWRMALCSPLARSQARTVPPTSPENRILPSGV